MNVSKTQSLFLFHDLWFAASRKSSGFNLLVNMKLVQFFHECNLICLTLILLVLKAFYHERLIEDNCDLIKPWLLLILKMFTLLLYFSSIFRWMPFPFGSQGCVTKFNCGKS